MINQLETLYHNYNQTHHNQLTIENYKGTYRLSNQVMPNISVPLSVFETSPNLNQTFKAIASFFDNMAYAHLDMRATERIIS
jgi:hypothetical protein